jgi:hypothetical protein
MKAVVSLVAATSIAVLGLAPSAVADVRQPAGLRDATFECAQHSIQLDVASAAKLKLRLGKKGPTALGMIRARQIATALEPQIDPADVCEGEASTYFQTSLDAISALIDSGDTDGALSEFESLITSMSYRSLPRGDRARSLLQRAKGEPQCQGIEATREFMLPSDVSDGLAAAAYAMRQADFASDAGVSERWMGQGQAAVQTAWANMEAYIQAGAGGATTPADWLAVAAAAQILGLDPESGGVMTAMDRARAAAASTYRVQMKSKCPTEREIPCMGRALAAYAMLGGGESEVAQMTKEWGKAWLDSKDPNKPKECRGELYELVYYWDTPLSGTGGHTTWIKFKIKNGKIVFQNFPVLTLKGGGKIAVYSAQTGGVLDTGTYVGGEFSLNTRLTLTGSQVTNTSVTLAPFFGSDNEMASYEQSWKCPICVIGYEVNAEELWAKNDAALAPLFAMTSGFTFARKKTDIIPVPDGYLNVIYRGEK